MVVNRGFSGCEMYCLHYSRRDRRHEMHPADSCNRLFTRLPLDIRVTFAEIKTVSTSREIDTLEDVSGLDFKTPFDELTELRSILTTQEIAELTGLRRETISRARRDSRFQRRTEKAVGDLYLVVTRMRSILGDDLGQLAAVLRRPQAVLDDRSIAELLKEGRVDLVLEHLAAPEPVPSTTLWPGAESAADVEAYLVGDPELADRLPAIEARVREHFGPDVRIERGLDIEPGSPVVGFSLRVRNGLSFDENLARLTSVLIDRDLLEPVADRLTIGFL
jgi:hypothetical protein